MRIIIYISLIFILTFFMVYGDLFLIKTFKILFVSKPNIVFFTFLLSISYYIVFALVERFDH